jgi:N-acetylglucosaminyldiphosphoundecaprenol N-acetyl-beta-D-mannosaminyltransferase
MTTRSELLGCPIDALTLDQAAECCVEAARARKSFLVGVVNAAKIVQLRDDAELRASVELADIVLADGMSVVWASRLLGSPLPARVTGIDLFEALLARAETGGLSVYLLGARPEVLRAVLAVLRVRHPRLVVAGYRDGYFGADEEPDVVRAIRESRAHFLFVGMPTPKKEIFLRVWREQLAGITCHGVGGSFDVLGGYVRRAPRLWQRLGLEWLYRLLQEPRRMWRRYLVTNTLFLARVGRAWISRSGTGV